MTQDQAFLDGEADAWFLRNKDALASVRGDMPLRLVEMYDLAPTWALEVGCANGWRLDALRRDYGAKHCVGIDPSLVALEAGRASFPDLDLRHGTAAALPCAEGEVYDLVVVYFVLHWVGRSQLLRSLAEIDRVTEGAGHVIIGDFLPNSPRKEPYHHRPGLWTYTTDYSAILEATGMFTRIARLTFDHETRALGGIVPERRRCTCDLLRKESTFRT